MTAENKKSQIKRLKNLAEEIKQNIRGVKKPLIIELYGLPKSGKTTIINSIALFLRRNEIATKVITERASVCPLKDKKSIFFNVWTGCMALTNILETIDSGSYQVIILDRGIYDSIVWLNVLREGNRYLDSEIEIIKNFFMMKRWQEKIDMVIYLKTTIDKAIEREFKDLLTDIQGSIMNQDMLGMYLREAEKLKKEFKEKTKCFEEFNTTDNETEDNVAEITIKVLEQLKMISDEELIVVKQSELADMLMSTSIIKDSIQITAISRVIDLKKEIVKRSIAETMEEYLQIIPVVIFKNHDNIAFFTKLEVNENMRLHNKNMIWIGGHFRNDDYIENDFTISLINCLKREIREELNIALPERIELVSIVYDQTLVKSRQHMGFVFLCDGIEESLIKKIDRKRIHEKTGQGVFIEFMNVLDKQNEIKKMELEKWTVLMLNEMYNLGIKPEGSQMYLF